MTKTNRTVLWWGRFDPDYSRNRILRSALRDAGWDIVDFRPSISKLGDWEALLRGVRRPDLVWVPCFRQRDVLAAARFARRHAVPLLFDPLISAWDKQVFEREKFAPDSAAGQKLLESEREQFRAADMVLADTGAHARFFAETFDLMPDRLAVVPVGAEEPHFHAAPMPPRDGRPLEALFYGSFLGLQGPETIIESARLYDGPPVTWTMLGEGPLLAACRHRAEGLANVVFEPWRAYADLPARIRRADILLGVFGASAKAGRVIPNKVYQALACGRPVITREAPAYAERLGATADKTGLAQIPPDDPAALARMVAAWAAKPEWLDTLGGAAARSYERHFSNRAVRAALNSALEQLFPGNTKAR